MNDDIGAYNPDEPPGHGTVYWHEAVPAWGDMPTDRSSVAQSLVAVRSDVVSLAVRAACHPIVGARTLAAGHSLRSVLAFLAWVPSGRCLGTQGVFRPTGERSPLESFLRSSAAVAPGGRRTIGLAMIAQDEEATIGAALDSARPWVDDMVVVDGGSGDATVAIAQAAGARVISAAWPGDFSIQRNASLDALATDWVLVLDADERVGPALGPCLRQIVQQTDAVGAYLPFLHQYVERGNEPVFWPSYTLRLFQGHLRYAGRVHETLLGCTKTIHVPFSGPYLVHRKGLARQLRGYRRYMALEQSDWSDEVVADLEREIAENRERGEPGLGLSPCG